jgi:N-acetylmuramoyl-L-alanine amidase
MRRPVVLLTSLIALATGAAGVSAGELAGLQLVQAGQGTRAELALDGAPEFKYFRLQNPDRLVVDLPGTRLKAGVRLPGGNGAVASLRTGQPAPGTLRIVFDLGLPVAATARMDRRGADSVLVVDFGGTGDAGAPATASSVARDVDPVAAFARVDTASLRPRDPGPVPSVATALPDEPTRLFPGDPAASSPPGFATPDPSVATPSAAATLRPAQPPSAASQVTAPVAAAAATPARSSLAIPAGPKPARTLQDVIGPGQRELVVAIDAGHGGKDPGALGPSGVREKAVTLAVARELARLIDADPGMRAVLTRDGDQFVPLKQRYMKARSAQADLFISIHADAALNDSANGASVYVLSTRGASSQAARWLADKENAADLVGGVSLDTRDHHLAAVLLDLSQSATMRASDDVASQVLGSLKRMGKAHKPAIERANFVVLRSPDVPSMLVETGFITNPGEERKLNDPAHRARLAAAIAEGVRRYFVAQPPPGTWFAARSGGGDAAGASATSVASAPD